MAIRIGGTLMTSDQASHTAEWPRARRGRWRQSLDHLALPPAARSTGMP
jgi:hypothetical protein